MSIRSFYIDRELAFALWAHAWGDKNEAFAAVDQLMKDLGVLENGHDEHENKAATSGGAAASSKAANDA